MSENAISDFKQNQLKDTMQKLNILSKDIEESFITGSGSGGQKVNKTANCVVLKHIPSGIVIKCQKTRSREQNRFFARRSLCEKIDEIVNGTQSVQAKKIERLKKQKKRRKKKTKDKLSS